LFPVLTAHWRTPGFYRILAVMRPVTRGLLTSLLWLGLALGFTSALSNVLQDRHVMDVPEDTRLPVR